MLAKQSTAFTAIVGPVLDSAGVEYASAVIGDMSISKNGGTLTAMASAATLTYIANGMYTLVTTTGNTDTLGVIQITCQKSTYQMPKLERHIVPATVYDAIVTNAVNATGGLVGATGTVTALAGAIATTTNITAASGVSLTVADSPVMQSGTASAGTGLSITIATALGANNLPIGCIIKITSGTGANQARVISGYVNSTKVVSVYKAWSTTPDATSVYSILYNDAPKVDISAKIAGVILVDTLTTYTGNTPQTGDVYAQTNSGTFGLSVIKDYVDDIGTAGAGLTALGDTRIANLDAATSSRMATYAQPTGFLAASFPSDPADQSLIIAATDVILTATNLRATQVSVDVIDDFLDTEIAAIKAKTDQFVFTVANQVDANALSGGNGLDAAGTRAALGMASANLDTQLSTIDDFLDTEVSAIKAKTDNLPTDPADQSLIIAATDAVMSRLGSPAGASMSADVAAVQSDTNDIQSRIPATLSGGGFMKSDVYAFVESPAQMHLSGVPGVNVVSMSIDAMTASALAADAVAEIQSGLATQASVNTIDDFLDTEIAAIKAKTDNLPSDPADQSAVEAAITAAAIGATDIRSALGMAAADMDDQLTEIKDLESFVLAGIFGNVLNSKTPDEAFSIILNGSTYTATQHGLDSDGNRGTAVLVKS